MQKASDDFVAGWIPSTQSAGSNVRQLSSYAPTELKAQNVDYFRAYARQNFSGPFVYGIGTEQILDRLAQSGSGGRWIDFGAGTSTLFWACAVKRMDEIACVDICPEALAVLQEIVQSDDVPDCYTTALQRYGRDEAHLEQARGDSFDYWVFDFARTVPGAFKSVFSLASAIGSFGIVGGTTGFSSCVKNAAQVLAPRGRIVGANWRRTPQNIKQEGHDTSFLTADFISHALLGAGLIKVLQQVVPLPGDDRYGEVVIWSAEVPGANR